MSTAKELEPRTTKPRPATKNLATKGLIHQIFASKAPEKTVRQIPSQSLYLAAKQQSIQASADLIAIISHEQCRAMLDFDLWQGDELFEDNFWSWLELPDQYDSDLDILMKVVRSIDLKIFALMISRHIDSKTHEEATDEAPGPNYYTPDQGHTWIGVLVEDEHKRFLLARLLAYIFENDVELFYQLLAIPGVATTTVLEEEAYQEKAKRLEAEGIPSLDTACEAHQALSSAEVKQILESQPNAASSNSDDVGALSQVTIHTPEPLASLLALLPNPQEFELELSSVMNSAIVFFRVDYFELEQVVELIESVKGTINIGLERACSIDPTLSLPDIYHALGVQKLYRYGLQALSKLRQLALKCSTQEKEQEDDTQLLHILEGLERKMPVMPQFLTDEGTINLHDTKELPGGYRAIQNISAIKSLCVLLENLENKEGNF